MRSETASGRVGESAIKEVETASRRVGESATRHEAPERLGGTNLDGAVRVNMSVLWTRGKADGTIYRDQMRAELERYLEWNNNFVRTGMK